MRLDHVALTVSDHERSAAFYREHFGMTETVHSDEHLLILGDGTGPLLALSTSEDVPFGIPRTNHFGFRADDAAEVHAAREKFAAAGVAETEWQDDAGFFTRVQVLDPDGYRVELYAITLA